MQIILNGSPAETNASDVLALLSELGLSNKPVIVELCPKAISSKLSRLLREAE